MQYAAQVRQRHEAGVEQVAAVLPHELLQRLPVRLRRQRLQHRKRRRPAVLRPQGQERPGQPLQHRDQFAVAGVLLRPAGRRLDDAFDHGLKGGLEEVVELPHDRGRARLLLLHGPRRPQQLERLAQQAEPRQVGQQGQQHRLGRPQPQHRPRRTALGQRQHFQQFPTKTFRERRQRFAGRLRFAVKQRFFQEQRGRLPRWRRLPPRPPHRSRRPPRGARRRPGSDADRCRSWRRAAGP